MDNVDNGDSADGPAPYQHDPATVPALAQLADRACDEADDFLDVGLRISQLASESPTVSPQAVNELIHTFRYMLTATDSDSAQPGASLTPLDGPTQYPLALRDSGGEVRTLWAELAEHVTHPVAQARCHDIVFTLRLATDNRAAAARAARAYLQMAGGNLRLREQSLGLLRAWTLARSVGLSDLEAAVTTAMLDTVEHALEHSDDPYAVVPLLSALTAVKRAAPAQPPNAQAHDLLDRALRTYPQPHVVAEIAAVIRKRTADPKRIEQASRAEVTVLLDEASQAADPLVIRSILGQAASCARALQLPDLERLAVSRLQSAPPIQWTSVRTEPTPIPDLHIRWFLRPYRNAQHWREALGAWCCTDAPSGSYTHNQAQARELLTVSVMHRILPRSSFRDDLPRRSRPADDSTAEAHHVVQAETINIQFNGHLLADALDIVRTRFGIPAQDDLEKFFHSSGTRPELARTLARAFQLWWTGEHAASAHLAVPTVEAAVRALLLELNEPIYRAETGNNACQFPGLGALLKHLLDSDFDPDWERFLRTFLLEEGHNTRNLIAHGFMPEPDRATAALVLRASTLVVLITAAEAAQRDHDAVTAALAQPVTRPNRTWWQRAIAAAYAAYREFTR